MLLLIQFPCSPSICKSNWSKVKFYLIYTPVIRSTFQSFLHQFFFLLFARFSTWKIQVVSTEQMWMEDLTRSLFRYFALCQTFFESAGQCIKFSRSQQSFKLHLLYYIHQSGGHLRYVTFNAHILIRAKCQKLHTFLAKQESIFA